MRQHHSEKLLEQQYDPTLLESFPNPHPKQAPWVSFLCSEFTSLCPKTGQPDFAKIFVNYIPAGKMLESKAAKLYLGSFRNHGAFHEDCVGVILEDLKALLTPRYIEVIGEFHLRGGIAIWPYFNYSNNEEKYGRLRDRRTEGYVPGKYSSLSLRS